MVFDLETRLDKAAVARAFPPGNDETEPPEDRFEDKFPSPLFHEIICIGALRASQNDGVWRVDSFVAHHARDRDEKTLITNFVAAVEKHRPRLVTFNGSSFDLPVLRYRGAMHRVFAPGLYRFPYFHRYGESSVDLCDLLASYDGRAKTSLDTLCRVWGIPGKPDAINGGQVADYAEAGKFDEIAEYCEHDVAATYMVWLRHELFAGRLTPEAYAASESALADHIFDGGKFHLKAFLEMRPVKRSSV